MRTIEVRLGPWGRRSLSFPALAGVVLVPYAVLEAGSAVAVSALLGRPVAAITAPYLLFLGPCVVLLPFVFAFHADPARPASSRARVAAAGLTLFFLATCGAFAGSLSALGTGISPIGGWIFCGVVGGGVTFGAGYRVVLDLLERQPPSSPTRLT